MSMFVFLKYLTEYSSQMCRNNFKTSFSTAHHLQPFRKDPSGDTAIKEILVSWLRVAFFFFFSRRKKNPFSRMLEYFSRV